ncbi:MAG: hypothetical protein U1E70_20630 [Acetobacteraceae bacterium]|mgnify:CR=1 FL=1|nr:hypothetical protein [Pseudomonadota bacterium]
MVPVSFSTLTNRKIVIPSSRTNYYVVDKNHFVELMKPILKQIYVDAEWYVGFYPDIAQAIANRVVDSAADHYASFGYFEHRLPYPIEVDESWYLAQYQDVRDAVAQGLFPSAHDHFYIAGYQEGRLPCANFTLKCVADLQHAA